MTNDINKPKKVLLQREESRSRQDIATVMRVEGKPYRRSRTMP